MSMSNKSTFGRLAKVTTLSLGLAAATPNFADAAERPRLRHLIDRSTRQPVQAVDRVDAARRAESKRQLAEACRNLVTFCTTNAAWSATKKQACKEEAEDYCDWAEGELGGGSAPAPKPEPRRPKVTRDAGPKTAPKPKHQIRRPRTKPDAGFPDTGIHPDAGPVDTGVAVDGGLVVEHAEESHTLDELMAWMKGLCEDLKEYCCLIVLLLALLATGEGILLYTGRRKRKKLEDAIRKADGGYDVKVPLGGDEAAYIGPGGAKAPDPVRLDAGDMQAMQTLVDRAEVAVGVIDASMGGAQSNALHLAQELRDAISDLKTQTGTQPATRASSGDSVKTELPPFEPPSSGPAPAWPMAGGYAPSVKPADSQSQSVPEGMDNPTLGPEHFDVVSTQDAPDSAPTPAPAGLPSPSGSVPEHLRIAAAAGPTSQGAPASAPTPAGPPVPPPREQSEPGVTAGAATTDQRGAGFAAATIGSAPTVIKAAAADDLAKAARGGSGVDTQHRVPAPGSIQKLDTESLIPFSGRMTAGDKMDVLIQKINESGDDYVKVKSTKTDRIYYLHLAAFSNRNALGSLMDLDSETDVFSFHVVSVNEDGVPTQFYLNRK